MKLNRPEVVACHSEEGMAIEEAKKKSQGEGAMGWDMATMLGSIYIYMRGGGYY